MSTSSFIALEGFARGLWDLTFSFVSGTLNKPGHCLFLVIKPEL